MILAPDTKQPKLYRDPILPHLGAGKTLMFAHGFNIHFGQIKPPANVDVSMIAPKAPGHRVRELFTEGVGVPALVAVHQNPSGKALENALAYAMGLGCLKAGVIETDNTAGLLLDANVPTADARRPTGRGMTWGLFQF